MALPQPTRLSVTEAAGLGVARLVAEAEQGPPLVVTRHSKPVAALVSMRHLADIEKAAADLTDLALALTRTATDTGQRMSLDDVLAAFGHTQDSIAAVPDE